MQDAANSAALPASVDVTVKYEAAMVFAIVTSHTKQRPLHHGSKVRPSDPLPSVRRRPLGFLVAGILARVIELIKMIDVILIIVLYYSAVTAFT